MRVLNSLSLSISPVRPEALLTDKALCLPTFSHFLFVDKTSLSLSLQHHLSHHSTGGCPGDCDLQLHC